MNCPFPTPTWTYGTDDTVALQAIETYLEADTNRGIFGAAELPGGHSCLLQTLVINRPVTWRSSGSRQAQLLQIMGAQDSTIDGTRFGFVLVAANLPMFDQYQDTTAGQQEVGFDNIAIAGGTKSTTVDVDGSSGQPYTNDGLLFQNPAGMPHTVVSGILRDFQVVNFPGNGLSANNFTGLFRGYNVFAGAVGLNCVDIENTANPYRFYGLVAENCAGTGLNLVRGRRTGQDRDGINNNGRRKWRFRLDVR